MFPLRDENPHPPGFKPKLTIAFIIVNVIVFFYEVAYTGQFFEFTNGAAARYGALPSFCLSSHEKIWYYMIIVVYCPSMINIMTMPYMAIDSTIPINTL